MTRGGRGIAAFSLSCSSSVVFLRATLDDRIAHPHSPSLHASQRLDAGPPTSSAEAVLLRKEVSA